MQYRIPLKAQKARALGLAPQGASRPRALQGPLGALTGLLRLFAGTLLIRFLKAIYSSFFLPFSSGGTFSKTYLGFLRHFTRVSRIKNAWWADGRTDQPSYWDLWTHLTRLTRPIVVLEFTWIYLNSMCFRGFWENMSVTDGRMDGLTDLQSLL